MKNLCSALFISLFLMPFTAKTQVTWSQKTIDEHTIELTASFELAENDFVYQDYLNVRCSNPNVHLSSPTLSEKSTNSYDSRFKENKKQITKSFTLHCTASHEKPIEQDTCIHLSYFQKSKNQITEEIVTLTPENKSETLATTVDASCKEEVCTPSKENPCVKKCVPAKSWSTKISDLITDTDSLPLRILLVILLGILMSLTPCIYPMIPITVGILQSQATGSWTRNFSRALAYTFGIATTFAVMGLLAAFTGQVFGSIMVNPIFILTIVFLLVYLAGSMLGLYEMYIPSFLQPKQNGMKGSSLFAAFLFGAASGTVASPCLSPGLVLLLTLVTTLANKFMGFLLLFSFGIGLSIPLLLIGTFSSSINVLPRSGMWMIEMKRIFGLIMIGMCFYFLNNIMAWHILLWIMSTCALLAGIFYISTLKETHSSSGRYLKNILGVSLIGGSIFMAAQAFKATIEARRAANHWWLEDYSQALAQADHHKKLLFIDVTAPYCSICKAIDAKLFANPAVREQLCAFALPVKIDISRETEETKELRKKFDIIGAPLFLIIDPETEEVIARWGGEIYEYSVDEFVNVLKETAQ